MLDSEVCSGHGRRLYTARQARMCYVLIRPVVVGVDLSAHSSRLPPSSNGRVLMTRISATPWLAFDWPRPGPVMRLLPTPKSRYKSPVLTIPCCQEGAQYDRSEPTLVQSFRRTLRSERYERRAAGGSSKQHHDRPVDRVRIDASENFAIDASLAPEYEDTSRISCCRVGINAAPGT
ncbi:hypothetical protein FKP32DRAFT_42123 [Trametes sanguinea]|nr:hypothetical protein FKP32DRAFT_42123 [Trametes sanguinea]